MKILCSFQDMDCYIYAILRLCLRLVPRVFSFRKTGGRKSPGQEVRCCVELHYGTVLGIHHFHIDHNAPCLPPPPKKKKKEKKKAESLPLISLGATVIPRRNREKWVN